VTSCIRLSIISAAAGMSSGGMLAFTNTFGRFLERAFDQIEMAIVGGANLKLVGTHVGVTLASDGPSQMLSRTSPSCAPLRTVRTAGAIPRSRC
jgi:transketolase C-terminal domain/subunit